MWKEFVESFVFFPDPTIYQTPNQIPFQDIYVSHSKSKERYHGWLMEYKETSPYSGYIVLFFHGNAGNLSTRIPLYEKLYSQKISICAFDYPGFGKSQGKPTEESCLETALLFYQLLQKHFKYSSHKIILWGESIGGSIASHLSLTTHSPLLILQSTFTDIREMIKKVASKIPSFVYHPIGFHTQSYLQKRHKLAKINSNIKTLILHSREDEIIPFTHAEVLKRWTTVLIECKGKHTSPKMNEEILKRIMDFIETK